MTKLEFINDLSQRLSHLPRHEVDKVTSYYSEMAEDRMEDGMSEEEAVAAFGSVEDAAQSAMLEMSLPVLMKAKVSESKENANNKTLWIVLAVAGSPVWLPLLIAFAAIVFSIYIVAWSVIITLFAVLVGLASGAVVSIVCAIPAAMTLTPAMGLLSLGTGLILTGMALFLIKPVFYITKGLVQGTVLSIRKIKALFISGKEGGAQ